MFVTVRGTFTVEPVDIASSRGAANVAAYPEAPSVVSRSRSTSNGRDATNCAAITSAIAARILTPASKPWQRCLRMPMMARLEATVMRPDRVNVNTIACAYSHEHQHDDEGRLASASVNDHQKQNGDEGEEDLEVHRRHGRV